ncbi:MAG: PD-(D/E)XK nuclease family protein, partial [bacterium]
VELARGTGGGAPAIRVVADDGNGDPSVSVAPFRSAADDDRRARDREETKRLLYVATTRARDRLYLSATRTDGAVKVGSGSFATVLPKSLVNDLFTASGEEQVARWSGPAGPDSHPRSHTFSLVGSPSVGPDSPPAAVEATASPEGLLGPWRPSVGFPRIPVTGLAAVGPAEAPDPGAGSGPVVGRLVHRLLQRAGETGVGADADLESRVVDLMTREERARSDSRGLVLDAAAVFRRALSRPQVTELLQGDCLFEVPFSMRRDDLAQDEDLGRAQDDDVGGGPVVLRGTIDCLLRREDGRLTVIELKTGAARPHHERQLSLYLDAARALFPETSVDGTVVYL